MYLCYLKFIWLCNSAKEHVLWPGVSAISRENSLDKREWDFRGEAFCWRATLLWFILYCINKLSCLSTQVHFTAGKMEIQKLNALPMLCGKLLAKLGLLMNCFVLFPLNLHLLFFPVGDYFKFCRPASWVCSETGKDTKLNVIITQIYWDLIGNNVVPLE